MAVSSQGGFVFTGKYLPCRKVGFYGRFFTSISFIVVQKEKAFFDFFCYVAKIFGNIDETLCVW